MADVPPPPTNLPDSPGVYLFKGGRGRILYVGKARSLKKRVSSYFHKKPDQTKTAALLRAYKEIETIVTNTELEALLLENTLIKKHRPRYNICLRDDKTYPYITITTGESRPPGVGRTAGSGRRARLLRAVLGRIGPTHHADDHAAFPNPDLHPRDRREP